jgi:hypothetical protein
VQKDGRPIYKRLAQLSRIFSGCSLLRMDLKCGRSARLSCEIVDALIHNQQLQLRPVLGLEILWLLVPIILYNKKLKKPVIVAPLRLPARAAVERHTRCYASSKHETRGHSGEGQTHYLCHKRANDT